MRILMINHFPLTGSGSGVYTKNIAESLIKKGHEVCIIVPENTKNLPSDESYKLHPVYFKDKEDIENQLPFNFPCFTTHPRIIQTFYDLTDEEYNMYKIAFRNAIKEEVESFKPDVIHVGHVWTLASLAAEFNLPLVITSHGTDLIGYNQSDRFKKEAINAANKCDKIITISKDNYDLVNDIFKDESKSILIKNGYNPDIFHEQKFDKEEILKQLGINKSYPKIVAFTGKLTEIKGVDVLLKAAKIYEDDQTLTLISGDGELFEKLTNMAKELNLKNVYFLGNQTPQNLMKIYNIADVSVAPSRSEAFGLVVIEALACATPVIGSLVGGIPDIINDEVGRLIKVDDYKALATNILKILNKEIKFEKQKITDYVISNYSQDTLIDNLIKQYESIIKTK